MGESIILNTPLIWIGYTIAFALCLIGIKKRVGGYLLPILSASLCMLTTTYALLKGVDLYEASAVILIFLAANLTVYRKGGENK